MVIKMNKAEIKEDKRVKISGSVASSLNYGEKIIIDISILQLAKLWSTDRKIAEELELEGFGSAELEEKCTETLGLLDKFPEISIWDKEIEFGEVSFLGKPNDRDLEDNEGKIVRIYAEDLVGWNGEGVEVKLKKEVYRAYFGDKANLLIKMSPNMIKIGVRR